MYGLLLDEGKSQPVVLSIPVRVQDLDRKGRFINIATACFALPLLPGQSASPYPYPFVCLSACACARALSSSDRLVTVSLSLSLSLTSASSHGVVEQGKRARGEEEAAWSLAHSVQCSAARFRFRFGFGLI